MPGQDHDAGGHSVDHLKPDVHKDSLDPNGNPAPLGEAEPIGISRIHRQPRGLFGLPCELRIGRELLGSEGSLYQQKLYLLLVSMIYSLSKSIREIRFALPIRKETEAFIP